MYIEPTNRCQLACKGCKRGSRLDCDMTWDTFVNAVDNAKGEVVELYGHGEPFLHPQIVEMGEYLFSKGIKYRISTNCLEWTPEQVNRLLKANAHFILSWVKETDIRKVKAFACLCQGHSCTIQSIGVNAKAEEWANILGLHYASKRDGTPVDKEKMKSMCQNKMVYADGRITTCCRDFTGANIGVTDCRKCKDIWLS